MKKILAVLGVVLFVLGGLTLVVFLNLGENTDKVMEASEDSGNIPEKTIGDPKKAKVVVYEYADYGCTHCAEWSEYLDDLVTQYGGQLAIVFRSFDLGYQNGHNVSLAATAAQLQGYWKEFKNILFENQNDWFYADTTTLNALLQDYFLQASGNQGDVNKFMSDYKSEAVAKKVSFENKLGNKAGVNGTPTFRIGGKAMNASTLADTIAEKINGKK